MIRMKPKFLLGFFSRYNSESFFSEFSEKNAAPVYPYVGSPSSPRSNNPYMSASIIFRFFRVSGVVLLRRFSKIFYSVICPVAINMVDVPFRHLSVMQKPDDTVSKEKFSEGSYSSIPRATRFSPTFSARSFSCYCLIRDTFFPDKPPNFRSIGKNFTRRSVTKFNRRISHAEVYIT